MKRSRWLLYIFLLLLTAALVFAACSKNAVDDDDDDDIDETPPAAIADLTVLSFTTSTAVLQWTAPGDDGNDGIAMEYDMRGSLDSITAQNFDSAYHIDDAPAPLPAGMTHAYNLEDLDPDEKYYFAIKTRDEIGNWSGISNCVSFTTLPDMIVTFADSVLERLIREEINLPSGDIHRSDLVSLTEFHPQSEGITNLSGIENCVSLTWLDLFDNDISDLTPLENMTWLVVLYLNMNNVSDISPLANLTNLEMFTAGQNPLTDVSTIANMTQLHQLRLNDIDATDFSALYNLPLLNEIDLGSNWLGDISFVSNLSHVEYLGLYGNNISDISSLTGLTDLIHLDLSVNQITDIQPLVENSGLGEGDEIWLINNPLSEYSIDSLIPKLEERGVTVHQ